MNDFLLECTDDYDSDTEVDLKEGEGGTRRSCANKEMEDFFRSSCDSSGSSSPCLSNMKGGEARARERDGNVQQGSEEDLEGQSFHGHHRRLRQKRQQLPPLPNYLLSLPKEDQRWEMSGAQPVVLGSAGDSRERVYSVRFC